MRVLALVVCLLVLTACSLSKAEAEQIALDAFKEQNARVANLLAGRIDPKANPMLAVQADILRNEVIEKNEAAEVLRSVREDDGWHVVVTIPTEETVPQMDVYVKNDGSVTIPAVDEMIASIT